MFAPAILREACEGGLRKSHRLTLFHYSRHRHRRQMRVYLLSIGRFGYKTRLFFHNNILFLLLSILFTRCPTLLVALVLGSNPQLIFQISLVFLVLEPGMGS